MSSITLQLPQSYIEVESEEMEYIDGGFAVGKRFAGAAINTLIGIAIGGSALSVQGFIASVGKAEAKKIFTRTVISKLKSWGCSKLAWCVGGAVAFALNYADIGGAIADYLDAHDTYPNNGWIG